MQITERTPSPGENPGENVAASRASETIDELIDQHGPTTVHLYGDATLEALDERADPDVDQLVASAEPLATIDLSVFHTPPGDRLEAHDPVEHRGKMIRTLSKPSFMQPDPDAVEAWESVKDVCESNAYILTRVETDV